MADYPDWVLKHKKKGTYINRVNGKYYLYAAHSERIPGTNKVRRVSDGYIGRITEMDGLIPSADKVSGDVIVYEYGLHMTALAVSEGVIKGLTRNFRGSAEKIFIIGTLLAIEHSADESTFRSSYLSVVFSDVNIAQPLTDKQHTAVERCSRMVTDKLACVFGENGGMSTLLKGVHAVIVNKKTYLSKIPSEVESWLRENNIIWNLH